MRDFAPLQMPYEGSRAAFHSVVVQRIYHEDNLFAQRSYVLLAVHAFLLTAFTVLLAGQKSELTWPTAIPITLFGAFLGIFQAAFGRQTSRAIGFWREYARAIEDTWNIPFDHLLFDFYADAEVPTPFGLIEKKTRSQRALYRMFGRTSFLTSITMVIGLFFPAGLSLFWTISLALVLRKITGAYCVSALTSVSLVLVAAFAFRPSLAEPRGPTSRKDARSD